MSSPFLSQLAELQRADRTRAKWVIVPSHSLGHTLGERLALYGAGWTNVRFATPLDLALPMAAPFLVERGVDPAPDGIGPALIMRLLLKLPASVPPYFRGLAEQPQMAEALWVAIAELRMAGGTAAALPHAAFTDERKHAELRALLAAYEEHLVARRLADRAVVFHEALAHLDVCPIQPADLSIELPTTIWAPLERRLLDSLPGRIDREVTGDDFFGRGGICFEKRLRGLGKCGTHYARHRNEFRQDAVELLLVLIAHGLDRRHSGLIVGGGR